MSPESVKSELERRLASCYSTHNMDRVHNGTIYAMDDDHKIDGHHGLFGVRIADMVYESDAAFVKESRRQRPNELKALLEIIEKYPDASVIIAENLKCTAPHSDKMNSTTAQK